MRVTASRQAVFTPIDIFLISLYVLEFSASLTAIAIYKKGERPIQIFFAGSAGCVFIFAAVALVISTATIIYLFRKRVASGAKSFSMLLFSIVFGRIVNIGSDGIPYAIFYYAALLPWIYFSSTVTQSSLSLVNNARLVTKVYFPRSALPIAPALSGMVDLGIGTIILIVMMAYYGLHPTAKLFLWPVLVIMLACLSCTIGMVLSALNVRYRDVKHGFGQSFGR